MYIGYLHEGLIFIVLHVATMESADQAQQICELESIDLEVYNTSAKHQEEVPQHQTDEFCQDNKSTSSEDAPVKGNSSVALDEDIKVLWKRCNALLGSEKKITIFFIISACVHLCVLVSVTVSVSSYTMIISLGS